MPLSPPTRIDPIIVSRAHATIVGRQKQRQGSDMLRRDARLETLLIDDFLFAFGRLPAHLTRCLHIAGDNTGNANIVGTKLPRQSPRHALYASLGNFIERQIGQTEMP